MEICPKHLPASRLESRARDFLFAGQLKTGRSTTARSRPSLMVSALTLKIICILPGSEMKGPLAPKAVQKPALIMTGEERKQA